jgi:hypothetical protein
MARSHAMTPKRRAALKKAQLASARKRKGRGHFSRNRKRYAAAAVVGAGVFAAGAAAHRTKGRKLKGKGSGHPRNVSKRVPSRAVRNNADARRGKKPTPHGKTRVMYHHTSKENAAKIRKQGFKGSRAHDQHVFLSTKPLKDHRYGKSILKVKVNHNRLTRDTTPGSQGAMYYMVHEKHLKGTKVQGHRRSQAKAKLAKRQRGR